MRISRRELLAQMMAAPLVLRGQAATAPTAPVVLARCESYDEDQVALLSQMFDKIGGLGKLVNNKTVTIKVNMTGAPSNKLQGMPVSSTHYTHPKQVEALTHLLDAAGAKRIRFVESAWALSSDTLEEYMLDSGWNVRRLMAASDKVEFINTNVAGPSKKYVKFSVPGKSTIFPSYHLATAYDETDVFVSMAKLKQHATCGVTLSMKNLFGITPASIYGDDAGVDEPNETPQSGRVRTCHNGRRQPASIAAPELDPSSSRSDHYRMPHIVAELNAARPVHLTIVDGIESMAGGEGPWIRGSLRPVQPKVMLVGTNAVTTDTVATAVMGFNPREEHAGAFAECENSLLIAEQMRVGTADLKKIEVIGEKIENVMFRYAG